MRLEGKGDAAGKPRAKRLDTANGDCVRARDVKKFGKSRESGVPWVSCGEGLGTIEIADIGGLRYPTGGWIAREVDGRGL